MIRAAIFDNAGQPFRMECFSRPKLAPGEALVRVSLCTICGSDLHTVFGRRKSRTPSILGHESVGIVEEFAGEALDVTGELLRKGDRVVWSVAISCGSCFYCTRALPQKCESLLKYGHERLIPTHGPLGGLSTHCHLLRGTAVVKVPADLPNSVAAPAGCATATVAAAIRVGSLSAGTAGTPARTIIVMGLGMLGLTACAWIAANGDTAIACDVDEERLARARQFGADVTATPSVLREAVHSRTAGRGADLVLELSGSASAAQLGLDLLRVGGTAVWVGSVFPTPPVPVSPEEVVRRCLTVTGIHNYAPGDLKAAVEFLAANHRRFPFAGLVERTVPLDSVAEAFDSGERERPIRIGIECL